jgi:ferrous iron transport protein A
MLVLKKEVKLLPLTTANPGETLVIKKITGKDDVRQHLAEMGFVVDSKITVISKIGGNLILQVEDCRVALDQSMAQRIMY